MEMHAAHTQAGAGLGRRLQLQGSFGPGAAGHRQLGLGHAQRGALVGHRAAGQHAAGAVDQIGAQRHVAGLQCRQRQRLEVRVHRPAPVLVGRQSQQPAHVGQGLGRAAQLGQADDAVDAEHAEQARVVQPRAAFQAFVQVAQGLVVVAQLDQLVRQVAVQHHVEALALAGTGLAQRLVHVGEGLLRFAQLRVAAGDGGQQHAELVVLEDAQAFVSQRQHALERGAELAVAPAAARQADFGQQLAGAAVHVCKAALRFVELVHRLLRRGIPDEVKAAGQPGPTLGLQVAAPCRVLEGLLRRGDAALRIAVQQAPRPPRQAQRGRRGCASFLRTHARHCRAACARHTSHLRGRRTAPLR